MSTRKTQEVMAVRFAEQIASGWSDEVLLAKKPEDLRAAFGCTLDNANYVLKNELTKRKMC